MKGSRPQTAQVRTIEVTVTCPPGHEIPEALPQSLAYVSLPEETEAVSVAYRATAIEPGDLSFSPAGGVRVEVRASTRAHHGVSWYLTPDLVHHEVTKHGLPPSWVPAPPAWFTAAVQELREAADE